MLKAVRLSLLLILYLAPHAVLAHVTAPAIPVPDIPKPWEINPKPDSSIDIPPLMTPELIVRVRSSPYVISIWQHGHPWKSTCTFEIEVLGFHERAVHDLKAGYSDLCPTFDDQYLHASDGLEQGSKRIVYVGAMGGDGDHTGPLVRLLSYMDGAVRLQGTIELFNVRIVHDDGVIEAVKGEKLFSLCFTCGGRTPLADASVLVPVAVSFGDDRMQVQVALDREGRKAVVAEFDQLSERHLEVSPQDENAVQELRSDLLRFLKATLSTDKKD